MIFGIIDLIGKVIFLYLHPQMKNNSLTNEVKNPS